MPIKSVILDFDGTLASTAESIHLCMNETLSHFGYPLPALLSVRQTIGLTLEDSIMRLTEFRCDSSDIPKMVAKYRELYSRRADSLTNLFDGVAGTLTYLRSHGFQSILVSNKGRKGLHLLAEQLGIKDFLDAILSAEDVQFRKPDGRLYSEHIAPLLASESPETVLVVGDTESDLLFAKNAGLKSCWASYGYGDRQKCQDILPDFTIGYFEQLRDVVNV